MPVAEILAAAQAVMGTIQTISGASKAKRLMQQRTPYKTPDEIFKILQATQSRASQGYDSFTLNYLTSQTDRAFDKSAWLLSKYGDPGDVANDLSFMFDQKINSIMKIGAENHALNMENFGKYLSALNVVGENKAAEWKSKEDILKDKLQAAAADKAQGIQNIANAANTYIGAQSADKTGNLWKDKNQFGSPPNSFNMGSGAAPLPG